MIAKPSVSYHSLLADLRRLELPVGRPVLVHCAMRQLGPVVGGASTLLRAIRDAGGGLATIVVPTQTANNSTTSRYYLDATAGMDEAERAEYETKMPGFDSARSPSYRVGALSEYVRQRRTAVRSQHPQTSFAAVGPRAGELLRTHLVTSHLGDHSPLAALYDADGVALLLGVGFDRCTALHLAEYRLAGPRRKTYTCFVDWADGVARMSFDALDLDDSDFAVLGDAMRAEPWVREARVGRAPAYLVPIRQVVDFAVAWMQSHRSYADR